MPTSPLASLRGARHPRVLVAPDADHTWGPEAVELARRGGLALDDWQADGLGVMLSVGRDGLWCCKEYCEVCSRQNGKTIGLFLPRSLAGLLILGEKLVMWSAHEYKTAMEGFREFKAVLLTLGKETKPNRIIIPGGSADDIPIKISNTNGEESFERLDTGQRVKFIARSKGSGRGFGAANLIDEAYDYTREQQDALMPTLLAQPNPQFAYASSPPLSGDTGDVLYALRDRAESGGGGRLGWRDWGLGGDLDHLADLNLDDRENWARTNPALAGRLTEEKILILREAMTDQGFAREVLGVWPRQLSVGGVIDAALWAALADPSSTMTSRPVFAADCDPERQHSAIAAAGRRADGLVHLEIIEYRAGTAWVPARLAELRESWNPPCDPLIDPAGPAGAWLPELTELGFEPILMGGREMAQACGTLYESVAEKRELRHLNQQPLNSALSGSRKRPLGDAWAWHRVKSTTNISPLVAATVALHGFLLYGDAGDALDNIW